MKVDNCEMLNYFIPDEIYKDIYAIDFDKLIKKNIKGLIFDIDNTLVSYNQLRAEKKLINFLKILGDKNFKICFVSNNNAQRVDSFNSDFNFFSCASSKKPSIKSLNKALEHLAMKSENVAVVGDQLFTDVFAAKRMKMTALLVNPIEPVESLFFKLKRVGEKPFIKVYHKRKEKR